jgi:thiamine-monophosphate kinase
VPVGPGDDAAVVRCGGEKLVVTVDQVLDGVHFVLADHGPKAASRKALARSLSDIAAMAALPLGAVVSLALPRGFARADAEAIYAGLRELGDAFQCPVVGGDVSAWEAPLAIGVTVFGRPAGVPPALRSGAKVGDAICVTGAFGGAWRSSRHLEFVPRIPEARVLAGQYDLHALIDVSDGLARDLAHVCRASGVGAEVLAEAVPIHPDAACADDPLAAALGDGEDYELLAALPADQAERALAEQPLPVPLSRVGTIVPGAALTLVHADGRRRELPPTGWEHQT